MKNRISYFFQLMVSFLRKFNLWLIFFTLIAYTAPFVSPQTLSFVLFVGLAYPWLLLANVIFIFLWAASRMKYWWYSAVCVLLGWSYLSSIVGFNFFTKTPTGQVLKVMTYNIGGANVNAERLLKLNDFLTTENSDIICVQEFSSPNNIIYQMQRLMALSKYPYRATSTNNSTLIVSKYPVIKKESLSFENSNGGNGCTYADIQINDKVIRVYTVHLRSNVVSGLADDLAEHADYEKRATWSKMITMLRRVRIMAQYRAKESEKIAAHIATSPYPVMVCGDFNDIPVSYSYSVLSQNLKDTYRERGFGIGVTYNGNIPALKIDHILADKKIAVFNCEIVKVKYSDHFPIVSEIGLNY